MRSKDPISNSNIGCKLAVSKGITGFFEMRNMYIILDDCLLRKFFRFCEENLKFYKIIKIFYIFGVNFQKKILNIVVIIIFLKYHIFGVGLLGQIDGLVMMLI